MNVIAISDEFINNELFDDIEIGQDIFGNAKSYNQKFIWIETYVKIKEVSNDEEYPYETKVVKCKIKEGSIEKIFCYYDDEYCSKDVTPTNTHHKYLCGSCLREYNSCSDEELPQNGNVMDYMRDWD